MKCKKCEDSGRVFSQDGPWTDECECQSVDEETRDKKYVVQAYIPADADQEVLDITDAIAEVEQQKLLNPENIYMIKNINTGDEYGPK